MIKKEPAISANDSQVGGSHYRGSTIQPWDVMESWFTGVEFEAYLRGNVIKYIARYDKKGGLQDLLKAQHYLSKLIEVYDGNVNADSSSV